MILPNYTIEIQMKKFILSILTIAFFVTNVFCQNHFIKLNSGIQYIDSISEYYSKKNLDSAKDDVSFKQINFTPLNIEVT